MLTNKMSRAKRKLNLTPQTVAVISSTEQTDGIFAPLSTHQTNQASCKQERELNVPPAPTPNQQPQTPVPPVQKA